MWIRNVISRRYLPECTYVLRTPSPDQFDFSTCFHRLPFANHFPSREFCQPQLIKKPPWIVIRQGDVKEISSCFHQAISDKQCEDGRTRTLQRTCGRSPCKVLGNHPSDYAFGVLLDWRHESAVCCSSLATPSLRTLNISGDYARYLIFF